MTTYPMKLTCTKCGATDEGTLHIEDSKPLTDEQKAILKECRNQAMKWVAQARIPECGAFSGIAQDLDWLCNQLVIEAAHGIKENT